MIFETTNRQSTRLDNLHKKIRELDAAIAGGRIDNALALLTEMSHIETDIALDVIESGIGNNV